MIKVNEFMKKYKINPTAKNIRVAKGLNELTLHNYIMEIISDIEIAKRCFITAKTLQNLRKVHSDKNSLILRLYRNEAVSQVCSELEELHGVIECSK